MNGRGKTIGKRIAGVAILACAAIPAAFALSFARVPETKANVVAQKVAAQKPVHARKAVVAAASKPAPIKPTPAAYVIKRILPIDGPLHHGEWHWDEKGVPKGEVVITVDLAAETLSIFRAGYEIGTTTVIFGADDMPTPLGVFPITQKDIDHHSNIYDNAPMPYMLRMTNDGITIHGAEVNAREATHGCIGVPNAFAKKLFAATKLGDTVIVTNGEMLDTGGAITAI